MWLAPNASRSGPDGSGCAGDSADAEAFPGGGGAPDAVAFAAAEGVVAAWLPQWAFQLIWNGTVTAAEAAAAGARTEPATMAAQATDRRTKSIMATSKNSAVD